MVFCHALTRSPNEYCQLRCCAREKQCHMYSQTDLIGNVLHTLQSSKILCLSLLTLLDARCQTRIRIPGPHDPQTNPSHCAGSPRPSPWPEALSDPDYLHIISALSFAFTVVPEEKSWVIHILSTVAGGICGLPLDVSTWGNNRFAPFWMVVIADWNEYRPLVENIFIRRNYLTSGPSRSFVLLDTWAYPVYPLSINI